MVSVLKEKLKSGSLVPGSEVGKSKERRGVGEWRREGGDADYMCKKRILCEKSHIKCE